MKDTDHTYYISAFNTPDGHRVLRDLFNAFDTSNVFESNEVATSLITGRRQVIDYIKNRMKQACGKNKKPYADIIYEVTQL